MNVPENREEAIFAGALQLPAEKRAEYLRLACSEDAALRQAVEALLRANDQAAGFMESPPAAGPAPTIVLSLPLTEKAGDRIGRYKLLQQIGEGGCGVVYMAEQEEPVRRRVALKVIKLGMDTKSVIARFEAERQALALMDHPNIAKVLDAGSTETGRPFFVMELVRGIKITEYCDQNKLSTEERLKLFAQVCHAIQHAHQKGIIHRDIKPSNILVTLHDSVPVPKVIDFGIAKATQGRLTDQTLFTAFEQFIGTPAYMSPEQAEMSGLDVDTRSDIYALGVLLYELLTGRTPFDPKELIQSGLDEMRRTIREVEPARPSTRMSTMLNAELTSAASHRRTEAPKLIHTLRGDLDWIVMKALEKDRTRRYETANGLAMDIQRHMTNEPVAACPPSTLYRLQKLIRRNKAAFAVVITGVLGLMLVTAVSLRLFVVQSRLRQQAEEATKRAEADAKLKADLLARRQISDTISSAGFYLTQQRYDDADKEISKIPFSEVTNYPSTAAIFNLLGQIHARREQWRIAQTNYDLVVRFKPDDDSAYHFLAPLLVWNGELEAYQHHREQALSQFGAATNSITAERTAKDCLILPPATADLARIGKLVDVAVAAGPSAQYWDYVRFVKGFFEYRSGHFAIAVEWLKPIVGLEQQWNRTVQAYMVLAMAQYQLQEVNEAKATLAQGLATAERTLNKSDQELNGDWNDWVIAHLLMRDAQSLIEGSAKPANR